MLFVVIYSNPGLCRPGNVNGVELCIGVFCYACMALKLCRAMHRHVGVC